MKYGRLLTEEEKAILRKAGDFTKPKGYQWTLPLDDNLSAVKPQQVEQRNEKRSY